MFTCKQMVEGDEMVCTCGRRWAVNEDDPHPDIDTVAKEVGNKHLAALREKVRVRRTIEERRVEKERKDSLAEEYNRYTFECGCNGEIPMEIGDAWE